MILSCFVCGVLLVEMCFNNGKSDWNVCIFVYSTSAPNANGISKTESSKLLGDFCILSLECKD